jgi:pilus assembly protein Flp/PilA
VNELLARLMVVLQRDRKTGQAMVEYALLAGLISVVAIVALTTIGTDVNLIYTNIASRLNAVPGV